MMVCLFGRYCTFLFLIQVCLISPQCIESDLYVDITEKIELFLQANSYEKIREEVGAIAQYSFPMSNWLTFQMHHEQKKLHLASYS